MNNIILIALEQEAPNMASWDNVFFTGVGKVNAGITAGRLIEEHAPHTVWNFGTVGGVTVTNGVHEIKNFVQRDMSCCEMGFEIGQTPFEDDKVISFGDEVYDMCCSTGDNFVSDISNLDLIADVVDMEAYAIAKACKQANVNFRCFKYVSDLADENASDEWQKTVANGEQEYIKIFQQIIGGF